MAAMEAIANKGNGNYAYIDSVREARKVLSDQFGGTLITIAKDVKLQVEFNPAHVAGYRLIGYENRKLAARDFNDDKKDAGELGAGHTVTALYELVPAGQTVPESTVDALKYQKPMAQARAADAPPRLHVFDYAPGWAPLVQRAAKAMMRGRRGKDGRFMADARYQECFDSEDYQEGLRAFAEGRDPVFNGS